MLPCELIYNGSIMLRNKKKPIKAGVFTRIESSLILPGEFVQTSGQDVLL